MIGAFHRGSTLEVKAPARQPDDKTGEKALKGLRRRASLVTEGVGKIHANGKNALGFLGCKCGALTLLTRRV
jgi:hypothetical protein